MNVTCYKVSEENGECGVPDDPPYIETKTFEFDHTPAITAVNAISTGPNEVQGEVKYDADSAWTDNGIIVERLGSSTPSGYFPGDHNTSGHHTTDSALSPMVPAQRW